MTQLEPPPESTQVSDAVSVDRPWDGTTPLSHYGTDQRISLLVHAGAKIGKSTLTGTAPKPVLVLDAEGSWRFIPVRKIFWDPVTGPPPPYDGTWDACIVTVREWSTVELVFSYVSRFILPFVSIIIDSITEIQRRCKANLIGTEQMKIADWGVLLTKMDATIRGFRDLALVPNLAVRCVVFVAETRQGTSGKWVPYMQGQIAVSLPYWVDICGYMYPDWEPDANGQAQREVRRLWISPHPQYEAGERVQGRLGGVITVEKPDFNTSGNDIATWMDIVFGLLPERAPENVGIVRAVDQQLVTAGLTPAADAQPVNTI